jgi:hypothetical protein
MGVQARWTVPRRRLGDCEQAARIRSAKGPGAPSPRCGGFDSEVTLGAVLADHAESGITNVPGAIVDQVFAACYITRGKKLAAIANPSGSLLYVVEKPVAGRA